MEWGIRYVFHYNDQGLDGDRGGGGDEEEGTGGDGFLRIMDQRALK